MYISHFEINNYRSLKGVKINGLLSVCIFHGLNNSGKSNILSALEMIFKRKLEEGTPNKWRPVRFWRGRIENFTDNFFKNDRKDITFSVTVSFEHAEVEPFMEILKKLKTHLEKPSYKKDLTLVGRIKYIDEHIANAELECVTLNTDYKIMTSSVGKGLELFPGLKDVSNEKKLQTFERIMDLMNDSFVVIPSNRFLTTEAESGKKDLPMTPNTFKAWLFNLSLDRSKYYMFQQIKDIFNGEPFKFGELSFTRNDNEIEIMVDKDGVRLPINRMGSGLQQILFLVSNLVLLKGKMVGIEELEINLSPTAQMQIFEKIKSYLKKDNKLISQVIITSHSDYFGGRGDVRCYETSHDGEKTIVSNWTNAMRRAFFKH
jgi:AAA15 family ATPase/GTPase